MKKPEFIDMKGLLSFHVMWLLRQKRMCGEELLKELGKRRDEKPSPGTLYPALNKLKSGGLIKSERDDKKVIYSPTVKGIQDLDVAIRYFKHVYGEIFTGRVEKPPEASEAKTKERDELEIDYI